MRTLLICLICLLGLSGCNTPSPAFHGLPFTRVTVEGSTFHVRVKGRRAEAIRVNPEYAPRLGVIELRAAHAMAMVSGCRVAGVKGDQAQAFGRLDCGKGAPPPRKRTQAFDCVPVRGSEIKEIGQLRVDLDCDPA